MNSRWQGIKRLGTEAGWVFAGQLLSVIGTLVGVRVLTEYLSPSVYGTLGLSLTISALFTEVIIGGLVGAFTRFYSIAAKADDVRGYVSGVRTLLMVAVGIAISMLLLISPLFILGFEGLTLQTGVVLTVFAALFGSNAALKAVLNGARRRKLVALNSVVDAWLKIGLAVLAIHWFGSSATSVLVAYATSLALVIVHQVYCVNRLTKGSGPIGHRSWTKEMFAFAWPASLWGVFTWAQLVVDRWSLQTFYSTVEVGLYSVVLQLGYFPMTLLLGMLGTFLTPILFEKTNANPKQIDETQDMVWGRIFWGGIFVSLFAASAAWGLRDVVFAIFTATEFRTMSAYLPVMVLAGGIFGTAGLLQVRLMSHMKMIQLAKIMISTALVGILMTLLLTAIWGMSGAIAAKLFFSVIYLGALAAVTIFYVRRES